MSVSDQRGPATEEKPFPASSHLLSDRERQACYKLGYLIDIYGVPHWSAKPIDGEALWCEMYPGLPYREGGEDAT